MSDPKAEEKKPKQPKDQKAEGKGSRIEDHKDKSDKKDGHKGDKKDDHKGDKKDDHKGDKKDDHKGDKKDDHKADKKDDHKGDKKEDHKEEKKDDQKHHKHHSKKDHKDEHKDDQGEKDDHKHHKHHKSGKDEKAEGKKSGHFDQQAANWDVNPLTRDLALKAHEVLKAKLEAAGIHKHSLHALEFGCGTGLVGALLDHYVKDFVGVDLSTEMINQFQQKIQEKNLAPRYSAHCIDILEKPLFKKKDPTKYQQFDLIYSCMVLHHIKDVSKTISEIVNRHLAPGGLLILFDILDDPTAKPAHHFHENIQKKNPGVDLGVHHENGFSEQFLTELLSTNLKLELSLDKCAYKMEHEELGEGSWPIFCALAKKPKN